MKDQITRQAAVMIIGGAVSVYCPQEVRIIILAFLILFCAGLNFIWQPQHFFARMRKPEAVLLALGLMIGFFYGMSADRALAKPLIIRDIQLEGTLIDWRLDRAAGKGVILLANNEKYTLWVYPSYEGVWAKGWDGLRQQDRIRFVGKLERPMPPGTAGEFDYPLYNAVRSLSGTIATSGEVMLLERGEPDLPWKIRQTVKTMLDKNWPSQAGVLEGILFGDSSGIPDKAMEMYRAAGVLHIFAASGANVAFVMILAWALFFFLSKRLRILAVIAVMVLYAALCQGNPPIIRATILGTAVLCGKTGSGRVPSLRWLFLAALLMMIYNPLYLKDISFQLSFAAVWGILVISPRLEKLPSIARLPGGMKQAAAVTLGAQAAVLPILIDAFHQVSLAGLVTNIFILFVFGAVLQLGLIGCLLVWIPGLPLVFFQAACWLLQGTDAVLGLVASSPIAYFWVLNPGPFFWMLWYGMIAVTLIGKKRVCFILQVQLRKSKRVRQRLFNSCQSTKEAATFSEGQPAPFRLLFKYKSILAAVILLAVISGYHLTKQEIEVTFLDVGQGDCILINTRKEVLMVDSGPRSDSFDAGERIIVPYLMEKRIDSLDMLFITHEDIDHAGGAGYLLANIPVHRVAIPEIATPSDLENWRSSLPAKLLDDPQSLTRLKAGDELLFASGLKVTVLAPVDVTRTGDGNSHSLVLLLDYLGYQILLTGDMDEAGMLEIKNRGAPWDADFLKVPHHGSKGSLDDDWFDRTAPLAVFIPVGPNRFGHPTPEVLSYWQERGVPVYRTDLQGTIRLIINKGGHRIAVGRQ